MKNILYADDSQDDRELMALAFSQSAKTLRLELVSTGELACDYLEGVGRFTDRARFPFPDLVLLDLKMTGMSGFDVLRRIRNHPELAGLLVAIYSSSYISADVQMSYKLGANAFIIKPSSWPRQVEFVRWLEECFASVPANLDLLRKIPEYQEMEINL